ncbi:MAG: hypothetical protein R3F60_00585 [bacterium]
MSATASFTWQPLPWFAPTVIGLAVVALVLAIRGWRVGGTFLGVVIPWLMGTACMAMGLVQWHLTDQALLLEFSWFGAIPPPVARYYLYMGFGIGVVPMVACLLRLVMRRGT